MEMSASSQISLNLVLLGILKMSHSELIFVMIWLPHQYPILSDCNVIAIVIVTQQRRQSTASSTDSSVGVTCCQRYDYDGNMTIL